MSYESPDHCSSPCQDDGSHEFVLLIITSDDKEQISQFELQYSTHTSRCILTLKVDQSAEFAKSLPFKVEVRRFEKCKSTAELDSWMAEVSNNAHRKIFNVSDCSYFAYVSVATGQVHSYVEEVPENLCNTTAPNSPCEPRSCPRSSGSGSSAASSVTSTPEKKKKKSRKFYSDEDSDEQSDAPWDMISIASATSSVSQLRHKVSRLDLSR